MRPSGTRIWRLLSVAAIGLVGGCTVDGPRVTDAASVSTGDAAECDSSAGCGVGKICRAGRCAAAPDCRSDEDCADGEQCVNGGCYGGNSGMDADDSGPGDDDADTVDPSTFPKCRVREYHDGANTGGEPFVRETYTYRADRQLKAETVEYRDYEAISHRETHTFDDRDLRVEIEKDSKLDGSVDELTTFEYTDEGRMRREVLDRDADETVDRRTEHLYDEQGLRIRTEVDLTGDGEPNRIERFSYNEEELLDVQGRDFGGDDEIDHRYLYSYDDRQRKIKIEKDFKNDRSIDLVETWTYEGDRLVENAVDRDADGEVDEVTTYTYEDGWLTRVEERDSDGTLDSRKDYEHTVEEGVHTERVKSDHDGDGLTDQVRVIEYSLGCIED